jgi:hypothetical protein
VIEIGLEWVRFVILALAESDDLLQFIRADQRVDFRQVLLDVATISFDQAPCDDQFFGAAGLFVLGHLQDCVDGLLLRGIDETASINDDYFGFIGTWSQLVAGGCKLTHHYFRIDEVLGTTETDKSYFQRCDIREETGVLTLRIPWPGERARIDPH